MWEYGGVDESHPEFFGRIFDFAGDSRDHANAVASVMVGAGVESNALGMAYKSNLHAYSRSGGYAYYCGCDP